MKFDERQVRGAMDRRLSGLEPSAARWAGIRRRIDREERTVKRKLTMSTAIAMILALTGAVLAVGINLFEIFGKDDERRDAGDDRHRATRRDGDAILRGRRDLRHHPSSCKSPRVQGGVHPHPDGTAGDILHPSRG